MAETIGKRKHSHTYIAPPSSSKSSGMKGIADVTTRTDSRQIKNDAGGYGYGVDVEEQLRRFLVLGARGTYYKAQKDVILENLVALDYFMDNIYAERVVDLLVEMRPRVPKSATLLACTAYCMRFGSVELKREIGKNIGKICWTGDDLFHLIDYARKFQRGWGRSFSRAIRNWYHGKDNDKLVKQMTKYQNRYNWSQRDVLKLASVYPLNAGMDAVFAYVVSRIRGGDDRRERAMRKVRSIRLTAAGYTTDTIDAVMYITAIENMWNHLANGDMDKAIKVGVEYKFPWELFPTEMLREWSLWEDHLLNVIGPRALLRQLNRLTSMGIADRPSTLRTVVAKFSDKQWVSGAHPASYVIALMQYAKGQSKDGNSTWEPIPALISAIERGFLLSYGDHSILGDDPGNKRIIVAIDVSPSMSDESYAKIDGMGDMLAVDVAALMGSVFLKGEAQGAVIPLRFASGGRYGPRHTDYRVSGIERMNADKSVDVLGFRKMVGDDAGWGGTDCSLPVMWAMENDVYVEHFVIITDNATWVGKDPNDALRKYRQKVNPNAGMIVIATSPGRATIVDPRDPKSLNCVGFDLATPQIIEEFAKGRLG